MQATLMTWVVVTALVGQGASNPIPKQELEYQQQCFKQWWGQDLNLQFTDLPATGKVADFRTPYSGFDYPDRAGGTIQAMAKYDRAFNGGRMLATEWERSDVSVHRNGRSEPETRRGLFGRMRVVRSAPRVPYWYGHCNGWTAAAIRHAEPQLSVTRNGVVFTPADIKGMLAEIYMYTDTEFLGGQDAVVHPALLHLTLTNWLGRGNHPVGIEAAVGEVVINYPLYSYKADITKLSDRSVEVSMIGTYAMNTNFETNEPARYNRQMYFHYQLQLDAKGQIIGGRYYSDTQYVDMLWTPLQPIQGGKKGNERGNPYLNIKEVLAIWRQSVPEDVRKKWLNIDPTNEDRVALEEEQLAAQPLPPSEQSEKKVEKKTQESSETASSATAPTAAPPGNPAVSNEVAPSAAAAVATP